MLRLARGFDIAIQVRAGEGYNQRTIRMRTMKPFDRRRALPCMQRNQQIRGLAFPRFEDLDTMPRLPQEAGPALRRMVVAGPVGGPLRHDK